MCLENKERTQPAEAVAPLSIQQYILRAYYAPVLGSTENTRTRHRSRHPHATSVLRESDNKQDEHQAKNEKRRTVLGVVHSLKSRCQGRPGSLIVVLSPWLSLTEMKVNREPKVRVGHVDTGSPLREEGDRARPLWRPKGQAFPQGCRLRKELTRRGIFWAFRKGNCSVDLALALSLSCDLKGSRRQ